MENKYSINEIFEILGKVCPTVDGEWISNRGYRKLCIVKDTKNNSYISIKDVPEGVDITNKAYWQKLCDSVGNIEKFDAEVDEVTTVDSNSLADASVSVTNDKLHFSFAIPRGINGKDGRNGIDAVGGRNVFAFKSSIEEPSIPTGGYWDINTNTLKAPDGWSINSNGLLPPVWLSNCIFGSDGYPSTEWSKPIKITGEDGNAGVDGSNMQFIYKLSGDETSKPSRPLTKPRDDFEAPEGWTNHPSGISPLNRIEWVSISIKPLNGGVWTPWSEPSIWSYYGVNGADGDGIKYAFKRTTEEKAPDIPEGTGESVEFPIGWTDDPTGVDSENRFEWVVISRYNGKTKKWTQWSKPSLWASYGKKGNDGLSGRTIFAFKPNPTKPERPVGGSWNTDTNVVTSPEGWFTDSDTPNPKRYPVWMSTGVFNEKGLLVGEWTDPIRITGNDGQAGTDGGNTQFIYKVTKNEYAVPNKPEEAPRDDFKAPVGWTDHPTGVTEDNKAEWVCIANKESSASGWNDWQGPTLWSNYGIQGTDGDGIKYAFKLTINGVNPGQPEGTGEIVENPDGWTDEPSGVTETFKFEWVCVSKYDGKNKTWSNWSVPALWSKYGENGKNGLNIEVRYARTDGSDDIPPIIKGNRNPGTIWSTTMPKKKDINDAIWGTQTLITFNNELYQEWTDPYLITGINGKNAAPINYKTYVYKNNPTKPNKPENNDPKNPGVGWEDYPNSPSGQWWQCIGLVNGTTELIIEWGEVIPLNGKDGIAQDGKYTEFRFAKGSDGSYPSLNKNDRYPNNWTKEFPTINPKLGDVLYMISAIITADNKLESGLWYGPVRISGETGPTGETGPAGKIGPTGIPGRTIEVRYCLGTEKDFDGIKTPSNVRNPEGWETTAPKTSSLKPYIWFIQATIEFSTYDRETGEVKGSWSKPNLLSGINGLPGKQGSKGQIIYPAGIYELSKDYLTTEQKAPYVWDTLANAFYVYNAVGVIWNGNQQGDRYPSQSNAWVKLENYDAIFAKIGIIANGLIGSAVFNGDFMFSQQGGGTTGNYEDFNKLDPMNPSNEFIPNICINFKTGEAWLGRGNVHLEANGNSSFNGNIISNNAIFGDVKGKHVEIKGDGLYETALKLKNGNNVKAYLQFISNLANLTLRDISDQYQSNLTPYVLDLINGSKEIVIDSKGELLSGKPGISLGNYCTIHGLAGLYADKSYDVSINNESVIKSSGTITLPTAGNENIGRIIFAKCVGDTTIRSVSRIMHANDNSYFKYSGGYYAENFNSRSLIFVSTISEWIAFYAYAAK